MLSIVRTDRLSPGSHADQAARRLTLLDDAEPLRDLAALQGNRKDRGTTVLLTTHYMEEAERLCDRLAIIDRGRILAEDTPRALVAGEVEPSVVEVRAGSRPPPPEIARQARVETIDGVWHCHTRVPNAVLASLQQYPGLEYLHRPANLEDVFLRLTGRELRD